MAHLVWFLGLVIVAVGRGNGNGGKINPGRLSVENNDVQKSLEDRKSGAKSKDNRSIVLHSAGQAYPAKIAAGSLTCMRWTGGMCKVFPCNEARGATCEDGYCVCKQAGTCADSEGKCVANSKGKWIGDYSIRFGKPFLPKRPFLGVGSSSSALFGGVPGSIAWLATVSEDDKQWKIAQTHNGRVRLTNTGHPGSVLTIYNNRRRSDFMQRGAQREQNKTKKISDNDDLWPVLMKLEAATPLAATFQVRPTMQNGGGYELWDPENQVALASADPDSWGDSVVGEGITECHMEDSWGDDPCEGGKQLIAFDPALPGKVLAEAHRSHIVAIATLNWWQSALLIFCCCCCAVCFISGDNDDSKPLIYHTFKYVEAQQRARLDVERERLADLERERLAFAEKVAGFWLLESDIGNFEYELRKTSDGISVHGRSEGASEWDSTFLGRYSGADQLCWDDDSGTKFMLAFEDDACSGTATAGLHQKVSFSGKRTEARA